MTASSIDTATLGAALAAITEEAGRLILPLWKSGLTVDAKADKSPVTEADRRAETLILMRLASAWPDVPVISEEDASEFGTPERIGPRFFLVDPLDGTKAFVRGDPSFTVNIGLIENGRPVAGAVTAPATGETWFTGEGGAWKRGPDWTGDRPAQAGDRPAQAGERSVSARKWRNGAALALISFTMKPEALDALKTEFGVAETQAMDSSIKLARLAEGSADLYVRRGPTMEWDIAAGHAILEAAGGSVLTPDGEPFMYGKAAEGFRNGPFVARGA